MAVAYVIVRSPYTPYSIHLRGTTNPKPHFLDLGLSSLKPSATLSEFSPFQKFIRVETRMNRTMENDTGLYRAYVWIPVGSERIRVPQTPQ